jgi:hypothetical protein
MEANNCTISVPNEGCDKNCPYCVSRMTGYVQTNYELFYKNLPVVRNIAASAGIASVLLTGKGEPFLNLECLENIVKEFSRYPIEVQTNGIRLFREYRDMAGESSDTEKQVKEENFMNLVGMFHILCFSIDSLAQFNQYGEMFMFISGSGGPLIRVTLNISDLLGGPSFNELIDLCRKYDVRQFSLRKLSIPNKTVLETEDQKETARWIEDHGDDPLYDRLVREMMTRGPVMVRQLPFGATVYDIDGISVTHFEYCIQDDNDTENTRSLIYQEDGHLYDNWWSRASILF